MGFIHHTVYKGNAMGIQWKNFDERFLKNVHRDFSKILNIVRGHLVACFKHPYGPNFWPHPGGHRIPLSFRDLDPLTLHFCTQKYYMYYLLRPYFDKRITNYGSSSSAFRNRWEEPQWHLGKKKKTESRKLISGPTTSRWIWSTHEYFKTVEYERPTPSRSGRTRYHLLEIGVVLSVDIVIRIPPLL